MGSAESPFWAATETQLIDQLGTTADGLLRIQADSLFSDLLKDMPKKRGHNTLSLLCAQFANPIIIMLTATSGLSFFLHDRLDSLIVLAIILISSLLGFFQEKGAHQAVEKLLATVSVKVRVLRDGKECEVDTKRVVPGDIVLLRAGSSVPGDSRILESKDLYVDESPLTGETFPVEKMPGEIAAATPLAKRSNVVFMGTHVVSGNAKVLVVKTGNKTEFGMISARLKLKPPKTEFEQGVQSFGFLLMQITFILLIAIFAINVYFHRPVLESFLFSLALAVGMTPQLLPTVISINLARGSRKMSTQKVIVKKLNSIENFGSMNILCSDKTGTLTEGVVHLYQALNIDGEESESICRFAYLNAFFQTGFKNPIDDAVCNFRKFDVSDYQKWDEVPYDFIRKRLSILVSQGEKRWVVTKGALHNVLSVCSGVQTKAGNIVSVDSLRMYLETKFSEYSEKGFRTLGLAYREASGISTIHKEDEQNMVFLGFLIFFDPPKKDVIQVIQKLRDLGVALKVITGDSAMVAKSVSQQLGLPTPEMITGAMLSAMSQSALSVAACRADIFAEVEPNQKERIIQALRKAGHVVGYMGDGINDASALHAADVGISVAGAVDVAKESADIVLLEKDLGVLADGIIEGRKTFANTLKYIFMATSANFGNMFSMAGASLFLPFLPLLPKQVLLTNLLTDCPAMAIAADYVDQELIQKPRRWDIGFIQRFMLIFGLLSSLFDYLIFAILLAGLHATTAQFRTAWFMESVISATLIVLVLRTRKPFFQSLPAWGLQLATLVVVASVLAIPWTPLSPLLGFEPLPLRFVASLLGIVICYLFSAEVSKKFFYGREDRRFFSDAKGG